MRLLVVRGCPEVPEALLGAVVCRDVLAPRPGKGALFRKGERLARVDLSRLARLDGQELRLLVPEDDEEPQPLASTRLAAAVAGEGVVLDPPRHGQVTLRAARRGWLLVERRLLEALNALAGVLVFTAPGERPTDRGDAVAAAKAADLLMPRRTLETVEALCRERGPLVRVVAFPRRRIALIASERLKGPALARAQATLAAKVAWFGSTLAPVLPVASQAAQIAAAFLTARAAAADAVLAAGAVATDPADPLFEGLRAAGGEVTRIGIPVDPGTACWVGRLGDRPVIGLASCELFGRVTALDLLLPRLLIGEEIDLQLLGALADGGLLGGGPPRIPRYSGVADQPGARGRHGQAGARTPSAPAPPALPEPASALSRSNDGEEELAERWPRSTT